MLITLIGDIAFTGVLSYEPNKNIQRFADIIPVLQKSNMVFANLEAPLNVDNTKNENKITIHYCLPEPAEQLLKLLNIGCVSLANNHIYDCKMSGLTATINLLDKMNIKHTGAGWKEEHLEPVIIKIEDKKIGFLAYVDKTTNPKTESYPELYINYFEPDKVLKQINEIKTKVDKIILSIHWGTEYSHFQTSFQVQIARKLIQEGVDIIMGHHPHTIQPFEKHLEGYILYSIGGLTFGDYIKEGKNELQALFRKTKWGIISNYNLTSNTLNFISTKEKKGNIVKISNKNYINWNKRHWRLFYWQNRNKFINKIFFLKEKIIDRVFEYFFGYYKNPIKRLFQFSNIKKIKKLIQ